MGGYPSGWPLGCFPRPTAPKTPAARSPACCPRQTCSPSPRRACRPLSPAPAPPTYSASLHIEVYMYLYVYVYRTFIVELLTVFERRSYSGEMIVCTLNRVLRKKGWSVYRLQKKSSITYPTLLALFHGKTQRYSGDVLSRLCYALDCRPADLLKWVPDRFPRLKRRSK